MGANIILILLFGVPFVLGIIIWLYSPSPSEEVKTSIDKSKFDGRILVDLSKCELSSYTGSVVHETRVLPPVPYQIDSYDGESPPMMDVSITYVKFKDDDREYVGIMRRDIISAEVALMEKKTTYIYYNKKHPSEYYFDLDF